MSFDKFWFKPEHQPNNEKPVEFELRPLNQAAFFRVQMSIAKQGHASWDDCEQIFMHNVSAWRGFEQDCSPQTRRGILADEGDSNWFIWLGQISGELYSRAILKGAERKNS